MAEDQKEIAAVLSKSIAREQVRKALGSSPTLTPEIKQQIRSQRENHDPEKVAKDIINNPFVPDRKTVSLFNEIYDEIHNDYPEVEAIVLKGSAALGGMTIRRAVNYDLSYETDADIALLIRKEPINRARIEKAYSKIVDVASKKVRLDSYSNSFPPGYHVDWDLPLYNFENSNDARTALSNASAKDLLLYFAPSCPPEVNKRNTQLLVKELSLLDKDDARKIKEQLIEQYETMLRVKNKHFDSDYIYDKDREQRGRIIDDSLDIYSEAFRQILNVGP